MSTRKERNQETRDMELREMQTRDFSSRDAEAHRIIGLDDYDPLNEPRPPEGMVYHWVREYIKDNEMDNNRLREMHRRGWRPVPASRHPEMGLDDFWGSVAETTREGYIRHKGGILCERRKELHDLEMKKSAQKAWIYEKSLPGIEKFQGIPGIHFTAEHVSRPNNYVPSEDARRQAHFSEGKRDDV